MRARALLSDFEKKNVGVVVESRDEALAKALRDLLALLAALAGSLLYAVGGESGIAIARVDFTPASV